MDHMSPSDRTWPAVILLQGADSDLPLAEATHELAHALVDEYADDVLLLKVATGLPQVRFDEAAVLPVLTVAAGSDSSANRAVVAALNRYAPHRAYVFLDVSGRDNPDGFTEQLVAHLDAADLDARLHLRLVRTHRGPLPAAWVSETDHARWRVLHTRVLSHTEGAIRGDDVSGARAEGGCGARTAPHPTWHDSRQDPEQVRVRLDQQGRVAAESLARWARAITRRRVGLALGGSGAWGFAHVALIMAMLDEGIPIDVICSSSSGSLVGGTYAALGRPGLEGLLADGYRLSLAVATAFVSMQPFEARLARQTSGVLLEELDVMFYPVVTNLTAMRAERVISGSLAWGVRASCTAPGLFGSTVHDGSVYVDGAVSLNVPAGLVSWLGADLVVAMNALPQPVGLAATGPRGPLFRLCQLRKSLGVVFQDMGRLQARGHITYNPPQAAYPLLRTMLFHRGREVCEAAQAEPEFQSTLEQLRDAWNANRQPRTGVQATQWARTA